MGGAEGDGSLHENNSGCRAKAGVMLRSSVAATQPQQQSVCNCTLIRCHALVYRRMQNLNLPFHEQ